MPRKESPVTVMARAAGYSNGYHKAKEDMAAEMKKLQADAKLKQVQAITALIEAQTKALSRTGYLIGKLNNSTGW